MWKALILAGCIVFLMYGCGSVDSGVEVFESVMLSADSKVTSLDADVIEWTILDENNDCCDYSYIESDSAEIDIRSELVSGHNLETSSTVRIESVRIDYHPIDGLTPPLASESRTLGQIIEPSGAKEIGVMIVNRVQKQQLLQELFYDPLCSPECTSRPIYRYHVKLTFHGVEAVSNRKGDFTTGLTLQVSDFFDDDECKLDPASICSP